MFFLDYRCQILILSFFIDKLYLERRGNNYGGNLENMYTYYHWCSYCYYSNDGRKDI